MPVPVLDCPTIMDDKPKVTNSVDIGPMSDRIDGDTLGHRNRYDQQRRDQRQPIAGADPCMTAIRA